MSTVSVHIVTFNSERDIEACLKAVMEQTYPVQEIIVVDNASGDRTSGILSRYPDRVKVIWNSDNRGFAGAHNQAIRVSTADYILILNPDVRLHPDYLRTLIQRAEQPSYSEVGSLTGKLLLLDNPELVDSCGLRMNKARRAFDLGNGEEAAMWTEEQYVFGVSGAAALYRRAMILDISFEGEFFDEQFFAYKEDVDVAWRAQLLGWRAAFIPDALAYHRRGWKTGGRKTQPMFVRKLSYINRYRLIRKNGRLADFIKHFFPILAYETASFGYSLLREPGLLAAWTTFIRDRKRMAVWRAFIKTKQTSKKVYKFPYYS